MPHDLPIGRRLEAAVAAVVRRALGLDQAGSDRRRPIQVPVLDRQGDPMAKPTTLAELRNAHFRFEALPDTIVLPPLPGVRDELLTKPLDEATVDDVAFASTAVEAEFSAVADRLHALKKLYELARKAGALGADRAVAAVLRDGR